MSSYWPRPVSLLLTLLFVIPTSPATRTKPFADWVVTDEKYSLRKTPASFSLIGYVYGDRDIGKEIERRKAYECFSEDFLSGLEDKRHKEDLSSEDILKAKNRSMDVSTFLNLSKKSDTKKEDIADVEASLKTEGVEIVVLEIKSAFKQTLSSGEILEHVLPKCREEVLDPNNWVVTRALGAGSAGYFFAKQDGTEVNVAAKVRDILRLKLGLKQDQLEIRVLEFDKSRYVGFVAEHWNPVTKQFEPFEPSKKKRKRK